MTELTEEEMTKMALEIATKGGGQGRAIVLHFIWHFEKKNPDKAREIIDTILASMPTTDFNGVIYVLREIKRTVDHFTIYPDQDVRDRLVDCAERGTETDCAIITAHLIVAYKRQNEQLVEYIKTEVLPKMSKDAREGILFVVSEHWAAHHIDIKKIVNEHLNNLAMTFVQKYTDRFNP